MNKARMFLCDTCRERKLDVRPYRDKNGDLGYFCSSKCFWDGEMIGDSDFMKELLSI